ncbi:MAG: class I SAM-dependent methyltransferase [Pseudomonadota bacterium]
MYRTPAINSVTRPKYPYGLVPAQLTWLCNAIDATRQADGGSEPGCIVEIGVAQGKSTVFLLEHMRDMGDTRPYYCVDTFSGFVDEHVEHEVNAREKKRAAFSAFSYNDEEIFKKNIEANGFSNMHTLAGDAVKVDWSSLPPIDVMLLDVDLYIPTLQILNNSRPFWSANAHILLDDVKPGGNWDGAEQAYREFTEANDLPYVKVGSKGGSIIQGGKQA